MCSLLSQTALAAPPPLPTPCPALCGPAAQPFVQFGSVAVPGVSGNTMTLVQSTSKAVLNWANFNIANGYAVNFVQPSATAAVLNNIWSADPSVIAGQLNANGQVYLYNQNGIVFHDGAQVNVGGLTASTLGFAPVTSSSDPDALFENGILSRNVAGQAPGAIFVGPSTGAPGSVQVDRGATLTTADGGRILLLGSAVTNQGLISTPDGQTILGAASNAVYLAASSNPTMRGLLIEVDGGGSTGTVLNDGTINAARGNITLAGLMVNQSGVLSATTSVSANGSIYLVAGDTSAGGSFFFNANPLNPEGTQTAFGGLLPNNGGTLLLAPGSTTEVLPDSTDTATLTAQERAGFLPSEVDLAGRVIGLEGSAAVVAPGGLVNVYAAGNPAYDVTLLTQPLADGGSIYLDAGSRIDVSGLADVPVPVTQNLVQVTLETNDLQNDPLNRTGFLHGTTVTVNLNAPPSLFDVTPYAANVGQGIDQILTNAGQVFLDATGQVTARSGSLLNVSGGSIAYQGGLGPATTQLLAANGAVYNISTAPADLPYVGLASGYSYTDPTWGTSVRGAGQTYYPGYIQGAAAGGITVQGPQVYLRGALLGQTVNGPYQRTPQTLAAGAALTLGCAGCTNGGTPNFGLDGGLTFDNDLTDNLVGDVVVDGYVVGSSGLPALTTLSPVELEQGGFNSIEVNSNGVITLPAQAPMTLAADGSLRIKSVDAIDLDSRIRAPGAGISLQTVSAGGQASDITLGAGALIDVSGTWVNDSPLLTLQPGTAPIVLNGGSVEASAAGNLVVDGGSGINVSGGGWISSSNELTAGNAGSIALSASFSLNPATPATTPYIGTVSLGSGVMLEGAGLTGGKGGTLSVQSGSISVGNVPQDTPGELLVRPDFFTQGGFARYELVGQNDVVIGDRSDSSDAAPVTIMPLQQSLLFTQDDQLQPTGSTLAGFTRLMTLPLVQRSPASVSFAATASDHSGGNIGDVTLARDASITTDPGASVTLRADGYNGSVLALGSIDAPAGSILLQVLSPQSLIQSGVDPGFMSGQRIEVGPGAVLAAPAFAKIDTLDALGYREGSVLSGGSISLLANKGFVQTDPGSSIDVSGAAGILDLPGTHGVAPTTVAGDAGTITLDAREGMVLQGNLVGEAASANGLPVAGAAAGTLMVGLGASYSDAGSLGTGAQNSTTGIFYPTNTRTLTLIGTDTSGSPALPLSNSLQSGTARITLAALSSGGFDNVELTSADTIAFAGNVALQSRSSLVLDSPGFVALPGAQVALSSAYVAVGNELNNPEYFDASLPSPNAVSVLNPTSGASTLTVNAQLLDIRGISGWSGFSQELWSSSGDIRLVAPEKQLVTAPSVDASSTAGGFEGALETAANVNLQAAQLYPTTATTFAIDDLPVRDTGPVPLGTVLTIRAVPGAASPVPLSAGGSLTLNATEINQDGVVRAPLGEIVLNGQPLLDTQGHVVDAGTVTLGAGSVTSVSGNGLLIPYGSTLNGTQWTYSPEAGFTDVVTSPAAKQISINASTVAVDSGATLDLSGGGNLYAYEFIAGQGGSVDVLDAASAGSSQRAVGTTVYSYAILPTLGSSFAPSDAQYAQSSHVGPDQTIYLSGIPGLAAGDYALLPAHYALLPGAYAIQVLAQNSNILPGTASAQPDGSYITAGRLGVAGTDILSSLSSTVQVAPSSTVRSAAQFTDSYADTFFSSAAHASGSSAPRLPADAGQLTLAATSTMSLNGTIDFKPASFVAGTSSSGETITQQGLGGDAAILAPNIIVADSGAQTSAPAGALQLNVQQLDGLNAQTLILGASTTATSGGAQLDVGGTQTVELMNSTPLSAPEVILAAQNSVTLDAGAELLATGTAGNSPNVLVMPGGGALLRVSTGAAATLDVPASSLPQNPGGTVAIGAGANVQASGSLLLYGTDTSTLASGAQINAPEVALYSSAVSLGSAPAGTPGLVLTDQLLGRLQGLTHLTIGSSSTIDFFGGVQLGTADSTTPALASITLNAGGIAGYGNGNTLLQAGTITLTNPSGAAAAFSTIPDGTGSLSLQTTAGELLLGSGVKSIAGFSAVTLQAAGDILTDGTGALTVVSAGPVPLALNGAAIIATAAANQSLSTAGAVTIGGVNPNAGLTLPGPGLGATLTIQGSSVAQNGTIDLPAGRVTLAATAGDVRLGAGSLTSAAAALQNYTVSAAAADAGQINLQARQGNVIINPGAAVDVSGLSPAGSPTSGAAGTLNVSAPQGTFSAAAGTLQGTAAAGQSGANFSLDEAAGLAGNGLATLDGLLSGGGFDGILALRSRSDAAVSIDGSVQARNFQLTADQGSIEVGSAAVVNTSGTAPGMNGGSIMLQAGGNLSVDAGAELLANGGAPGPIGANGLALPTEGGAITLASHAGNLTVASSPGQVTTISMQGGGDATTDGVLTLRAPRTVTDTNVLIAVNGASSIDLVTRRPVIVEGYKSYSASALGIADSGCGSGGTCDVADQAGMLYTDAATFVAQAASIGAGLGFANVEVRPGIEVDSTGDIVLSASASTWDLGAWHAGLGAPVDVTLRSAGNLVLQGSLSDGFTNNGLAPAAWAFGEPGTAPDSGSYQLTAGADLASADPLATIAQLAPSSSLAAPPNSGNFILTPGSLVRSGNGSISIAAGGDVLLGYAVTGAGGSLYQNGVLEVSESDPLSAPIYTAGEPSNLTATQASLFTAPHFSPALTRAGYAASYPTAGGDITISATDDIRSAMSSQLVTDWLWRRAPTNGSAGPAQNTTWWVMFNNFEQGVGALGGGQLGLTAGRDIVNTSAVVPTTGRMLAAAGSVPTAADLLLTGGGTLQVHAGGSIMSGVFENDWGHASIVAGGAFSSSSDSTFGQATAADQLNPAQLGIPAPGTQIYPVLVVGNGTFAVSTGGELSIEGVANSTNLPGTMTNEAIEGPLGLGGAFFPYPSSGDQSTLNLVSAGGNVYLGKDALNNVPMVALSAAGLVYQNASAATSYLAVYPATLNVASLSGDIDLGDPTLGRVTDNPVAVTVFPSASGNLTLLADGSINNDGKSYTISLSESDPTLMPSALAPSAPGAAAPSLPLVPLYASDAQTVAIVADKGNIGAGSITMPKAADVIAGGNITDLDYQGKNLNSNDVTLLSAGGDITYSTPTQPITNALLPNVEGITLGGPGYLEVLAGGSVNLGDAYGVVTTGSLADARLPSNGASLVVGAGFGTEASGGLRQPDEAAFTNAYLAPAHDGAPSAYASALISYLQQLDSGAHPNPGYTQALADFANLTPAQQLPLIAQILSDELSATGLAHTTQGSDYSRGYTAINTLFPTTDPSGTALRYSGDVNMVFSQLKTEQGGDINLLDPGGSVIVGVPNPPVSLSNVKTLNTATDLPIPAAVNLGVLVLGQGAIQGFADQSFQVNQSRMLTLEGGNIILWASNGNIDAGKGAKSASGAPPPVIETDANGNLFVDPSNAVSGSGIGQLLTTPGARPGLVNLIAPKGAVNAGDAGIRVAGNLNIAAVEVIGAANITVAGTSTGVPVSSAGALAGALSGANSLGDASSSALQQVSENLGASTNYQQLTQSLQPTYIVVKLFCLGIECQEN